MYIHTILHTQVEEIYTYDGNNVYKYLTQIIMSVDLQLFQAFRITGSSGSVDGIC